MERLSSNSYKGMIVISYLLFLCFTFIGSNSYKGMIVITMVDFNFFAETV